MKKLLAGLFLILALAIFFPQSAEAATIGKTSITSVTQKKRSHFVISYKTVKGADGYQVFYSRGTDKSYKKLASTKKVQYTTKSLSPGLYYFKVRAVRRVGGKLIYGKVSAAVARTVDSLSFPLDQYCAGMVEKDTLLSYAKWIGGMKKVSNKNYPDFCAKGNGVSIGCNYHAIDPVPYCIVKNTGNKALYMYGVGLGMTRSEVYAKATMPVYNNGNNINVWYAGVSLEYDKNGRVSSMTYRFSSTS